MSIAERNDTARPRHVAPVTDGLEGTAPACSLVPHRGHLRVVLLLAVLALAVVGPIVARYDAQPASRYALTAALAEHGTVDVGRYAHILGVDHARYGGELRSDKPPGQPLLGVPFYLLGRALGAQPATALRGDGDLGLWWQTFWSSMVPFAALLALMFMTASRFEPRAALPATLAIGFGTLVLPHAAYLYGHTLAALFAFGAWCMLDRSTGRVSLATAGFLAALAVSVEYHTAFIAVVVFGVALLRWRRRAGWLFLGALPPAIVTAAYQRQAFGHPWRLPYAYYAGKIGKVPTSRGGYSLPSAHSLVDLVAGKHGLLFLSPVVLVGLAAAVIVWRTTSGNVRIHAAVALAVFVPYALLIAGWSGTALLEEPGPRYLIPALPFLVVPLACSWSRLRRVAIATAAWGAVVMGAGTMTYIFVAPSNEPFRVYFHRVAHGDFVTTLWSIGLGRAGAALYVASILAAVFALYRAERAVRSRAAA